MIVGAIVIENLFKTLVENESLSSGSYKEHKITLDEGLYSFAVKESSRNEDVFMCLHLEIFAEWGQRVATDEGNMMPGRCYLNVPKTMRLKFRVVLEKTAPINNIRYEIISYKSDDGQFIMI